jgi:hypothetical protein
MGCSGLSEPRRNANLVKSDIGTKTLAIANELSCFFKVDLLISGIAP